MNRKATKPLDWKYNDINDNNKYLNGKTDAEKTIDGRHLTLLLLKTKKKHHYSIGNDLHEKTRENRIGSELKPKLKGALNQIEDTADAITLKNKFHKLIEINKSLKDIQIDLILKSGARINQKNWPLIPIHLQKAVKDETQKWKYQDTWKEQRQNFSVSEPVSTVKTNKTVKTALVSRKLNKFSMKWKHQMSNVEELISRLSRRRTDGTWDQILIWSLILITRRVY